MEKKILVVLLLAVLFVGALLFFAGYLNQNTESGRNSLTMVHMQKGEGWTCVDRNNDGVCDNGTTLAHTKMDTIRRIRNMHVLSAGLSFRD